MPAKVFFEYTILCLIECVQSQDSSTNRRDSTKTSNVRTLPILHHVIAHFLNESLEKNLDQYAEYMHWHQADGRSLLFLFSSFGLKEEVSTTTYIIFFGH
jgi:hypothetical protein